MCACMHAGSSLKPQRSGLLAATKLLLRTTASEVATMAQHPVRTGRSVLFGEPPGSEEPDVEPPSPRTVKRGIRTTLSRPLQVSFRFLVEVLLETSEPGMSTCSA